MNKNEEIVDFLSFDIGTMFSIVKGLFNGKSIARTLSDIVFKLNNNFYGDVIDLGAKSNKASYYNIVDFKNVKNIDYVDFYSNKEGVIKLNLEEEFLLEVETYDHIICYSVLEHIYNYQNLLNESYKILKPNGTFIGFTPFIYGYHPDPNDYFRYSSSALTKIFSLAGFTNIKTIMIGYGPFIAHANNISAHIPRLIRPILIIYFLLDWCFFKISKVNREKFAIGYFFVYKK